MYNFLAAARPRWLALGWGRLPRARSGGCLDGRSVLPIFSVLALLPFSVESRGACPATITEATVGFEAQAAGLVAGDCLVAWRSGETGAATSILDPLQVSEVELERAPLGDLYVNVRRKQRTRWIAMATGNWGLVLLPQVDAAQGRVLQVWASGLMPGRPAPSWVAETKSSRPREEVALDLWRAAKIADVGGLDEVDAVYRDALLRAKSDRAAIALIALARCTQSTRSMLLEKAATHCDVAIGAMGQAGWIRGALRARLAAINVLRQRGLNAKATSALNELEAEVVRVAPHSLLHVSVMYERAILLRQEDQLDAALSQLVAGQSLHHLLHGADASRKSFITLEGLIARARGDLAAAQPLLLKAVSLSERMSPDSIQLSRDLNNLALVLWDRGDLALAQQTLDRALDIKRRHWAAPIDLAATLNNLAFIAMSLGRLDAAEQYVNEALSIYRKAPPSVLLASTLVSSARIAQQNGAFSRAHVNYDEAIPLYRMFAPKSSAEAWLYHFRATLLSAEGRLDDALVDAQRSVSIQRQVSPVGRDLSFALHGRAEIFLASGNIRAAVKDYDEAIVLRRRQSPDSVSLAQSLHGAGTAAVVQGRQEDARKLFCEAVAVLERQRWRWSQKREDLIEFGESSAEIYRACAVSWLDVGNSIEAFNVLEQGRARLLLDSMTAHRNELVDALPAVLVSKWRALQARSTSLAPRELQRLQDELEKEARATAPAQARLLLAKPLQWSELRDRIPANTAVITHFHDRERFWVVLARRSAESPIFVRAPAPASAILDRARAFSDLLRTPSSDLRTIAGESAWLESQLFAPVATLLRGEARLLLVPDSEFGTFPFGALSDPRGAYLLERFSLRQSASLSAAGVSRSIAAADTIDTELLVVADAGARTMDGELLERWRVAGRSSVLPSLPGTAEEAREILSLYGSSAEALLGASATEKKVRDLARGARRLHFAVHGLIDPLRPLDSVLVLAPGSGAEDDDGLLFVRDVIADLHLRAELVVISACDMGGGRTYHGEGLMGLRHALHAAGVSDVLSSLWAVADNSGARLIGGFYRELRGGASSDQALRQAQKELIYGSSPPTQVARGVGRLVVHGVPVSERVHPFYWAGFVVDGSLD